MENPVATSFCLVIAICLTTLFSFYLFMIRDFLYRTSRTGQLSKAPTGRNRRSPSSFSRYPRYAKMGQPGLMKIQRFRKSR